MKRKILYFLLFFLILSIFPGILLFREYSIPDLYQDSYYAELPELYHKLRDTDSPKLVLIGSSNIAFGVDTTLLENTLSEKGYEYTVCPFGLYAAVGIPAMLDLSLDTLNKNDIVIFSFEPASDALSGYFGATAFLKCIENEPGLVTQLEKSRFANVIGNYIPYLQERSDIAYSGDFPIATGAYSKAAFDSTGNMTFLRENNEMLIGYDVSSPINLASLEFEEDFVKQVNDYCRKAEAKGITIYYSFCPMNNSALVDSSEEAIKSFYDKCGALESKIISNPNKYILDSGWFYDSNFHLNTAGSKLRTLYLAEDILAELGCYEKLDIEFPQMPNKIEKTKTEATVQNNTDFLFELTSEQNGYTITGLSEEGKIKSNLTIPSAYNDLPVVSLLPDSLSDTDSLQELRIPATITYLPDGIFKSCDSLERIILEHTEIPCKITEHSLDGAQNVKIFVPNDSYPLYRDGYGCETNLWSQYLSQIYTY